MPNDDQGSYPGEGHHYNQEPYAGQSTTQNSGPGSRGGNLPGQPSKQRNIWKAVAMVMSIIAIVFAATTLLAYNHIINPPAAKLTSIATQTPQQTTTVPATTSTGASTPSSMLTVQPSAPVTGGVIQENITLTCGGCNDPIHVTLNTVQIDTANGRMIWDNTLKDVTSSGNSFGFNEYNLQASTSQTPVQATLSQPQLSGSNQEDIQAIFAFVPFHNVTYTLSVIAYTENGGGVETGTTTFDSVKINF